MSSIKRLLGLAKLPTRAKPNVGMTPSDVVFTENKWRLLRYRSDRVTHARPILLVPSLINRHYVLDLLPGKSLAEWLVARGWDVYCIDWGTPGPEDRYVTFDDVCDAALGRAIRKTAKTSGADRVHLLGYCLGGTLTTIHAAVHHDRIASMCALAAPVRFDSPGLLEAWTRTPTFDVRAIVEATGNVPWQLMQSAFHMLRPTLGLSKTVHLIDRVWDDEFLDGFLALETWGNDNVSFPGECYVRYIEELYRGDALRKGTFTLGGKPARLENVTCPLLVVSFEHDDIVPKDAATALVDLAGAKIKQHIHLPGGHVGAVVSRSASKRLWPALDTFFAEHDASKPRRVPRAARA
ncbi:MAG TPA: alpha/beta fold hydrolase [Polyangiaceae bacterium]|jgi:polyhydroxyalkanoate synthase